MITELFNNFAVHPVIGIVLCATLITVVAIIFGANFNLVKVEHHHHGK